MAKKCETRLWCQLLVMTIVLSSQNYSLALENLMCITVYIYTVVNKKRRHLRLYSVSQKSSPPPKTFCDTFTYAKYICCQFTFHTYKNIFDYTGSPFVKISQKVLRGGQGCYLFLLTLYTFNCNCR